MQNNMFQFLLNTCSHADNGVPIKNNALNST